MFGIFVMRGRRSCVPAAARKEVLAPVGNNAPIRRFDALRAGQPLDLFGSAGRLPVVLELLSTPWLRRASDVDGPVRIEVPVPVEWDPERGRPAFFIRKGKRYEVDQVVTQWAIDTRWWDHERAVSRRCFRVIARGGVYDLAYDRLGERWLLIGVVD
jgi:hypothetical protein